MKIILCDNCGQPGDETRTGDFCDICLPLYLEKKQTLTAEEDLHKFELKKEFHIR